MSTSLNIYSKSQADALLGDKATLIKGAGAPTTSTVGVEGDFYYNTTNSALYQCTDVTGTGEPIVYTYTWSLVTPAYTTETWTFTLDDDTVVTKTVYLVPPSP